MLSDLPRVLEREDAPYNFNRGNVQQDPPPFPVPISSATCCSTTRWRRSPTGCWDPAWRKPLQRPTALPGGTQQPVHPDIGQLLLDLEQPTPPFGFVVNVPVVDMSPGERQHPARPGPISIPRCPRATRDAASAGGGAVSRARPGGARPSNLWSAPAASNLRHPALARGMPNHTEAPRPMIAMIHYIHWWNDSEPVSFPRGSESFFERPLC